MKILSHRGYWKTPDEKNSPTAFRRSFEHGFGTETDVRDLNGHLVISHDPPTEGALTFDYFLKLYAAFGKGLTLAINIKADGLQELLRTTLEQHEIKDYFVFDMSVPDTLGYLRAKMRVFSRHSEHEPHAAFFDRSTGVWMDCFESEWMGSEDINSHLLTGKEVCLVSPELHKRAHLAFWRSLRDWHLHEREHLLLCTDFPEEAREYFFGS